MIVPQRSSSLSRRAREADPPRSLNRWAGFCLGAVGFLAIAALGLFVLARLAS